VHSPIWDNRHGYIITNISNVRDIILDVNMRLRGQDKETVVFFKCQNLVNITGKLALTVLSGMSKTPMTFVLCNYLYNNHVAIDKQISANEWGSLWLCGLCNYILNNVATNVTINSANWGMITPRVFPHSNFIWDSRVDNMTHATGGSYGAHSSCFSFCQWMFNNKGYYWVGQPYLTYKNCYNSNDNSKPITDTNREGNNTIN